MQTDSEEEQRTKNWQRLYQYQQGSPSIVTGAVRSRKKNAAMYKRMASCKCLEAQDEWR